jgi:hypothetical protein
LIFFANNSYLLISLIIIRSKINKSNLIKKCHVHIPLKNNRFPRYSIGRREGRRPRRPHPHQSSSASLLLSLRPVGCSGAYRRPAHSWSRTLLAVIFPPARPRRLLRPPPLLRPLSLRCPLFAALSQQLLRRARRRGSRDSGSAVSGSLPPATPRSPRPLLGCPVASVVAPLRPRLGGVRSVRTWGLV